MKIKKLIMLAFVGTVAIANVNAQDGEALFTTCTACHTIGGGKLVGPDLAGVLDRRPEAEIISYIQNPAAFDVILMPPQNLSANEIKAILKYIVSKSPIANQTNVEEKEEIVIEPEVVLTLDDVTSGEHLFDGSTRFTNGGPSCISCHNVDYEQMMQGGLLAADLTKVYSRSGGMAGIKGMLTALPYPAMKSAYGDNPLTDKEVTQLQAFLKNTDENEIYQHHGEKETMFMYFGMAGFITILILIFLLWFNRKKGGVKDNIYNRQTKSI
ncbi:MAG TPA: cytochrome c [Flavobacteriales bacterium]|jgi:cytochrome c551/c552|nr:cytochrome c [Flavobacteriales bacterium]|tara:strand:- start:118 stop:924 length:807 start_codon:yes stop_codon:yes gene_type:complete